jgi:hypothetical protein
VLPVEQDDALVLIEEKLVEFPLTAKDEIFFFTFLPLQSGHFT